MCFMVQIFFWFLIHLCILVKRSVFLRMMMFYMVARKDIGKNNHLHYRNRKRMKYDFNM